MKHKTPLAIITTMDMSSSFSKFVDIVTNLVFLRVGQTQSQVLKFRSLLIYSQPHLAMLVREVDSTFTLSLVGLSYTLALMVVQFVKDGT